MPLLHLRKFFLNLKLSFQIICLNFQQSSYARNNGILSILVEVGKKGAAG
jgi:hypothetical protein